MVRNIGTIRHLIDRNYGREELSRLCAIKGTDYERLPGVTKRQKVNSLVTRYARDGQLVDLIKELGQQQPQLAGPPLPRTQELNGSAPDGKNGTGELRSALHLYLDDIKKKLIEADLHEKPGGHVALHQASALVRDAFSHLDLNRKRSLVEFLHENSLISRRKPLLSMRGANLSNVDLSWCNLDNAYLRYVNLSGVDLSLANLGGTDLSGSTLRGAQLKTYMIGAEMVKADLREADLSGAQLANASLAGANLRFAKLNGVDLRGANLTGVDLSFASLQEADLSESNLSFAILGQVNMSGAILKGAVLDNVDFRGTGPT